MKIMKEKGRFKYLSLTQEFIYIIIIAEKISKETLLPRKHTSWFESNSYPCFAARALAMPTDSYTFKNCIVNRVCYKSGRA